MDDYSQCLKCDPSDHEGIFCRCEARNIRVANERRARGESYWQPKRLNPEDAMFKSVIIDRLFDDKGNLISVCESPTTAHK